MGPSDTFVCWLPARWPIGTARLADADMAGGTVAAGPSSGIAFVGWAGSSRSPNFANSFSSFARNIFLRRARQPFPRSSLTNHNDKSLPADMDGQRTKELVRDKRRRRIAAIPGIGKGCATQKNREKTGSGIDGLPRREIVRREGGTLGRPVRLSSPVVLCLRRAEEQSGASAFPRVTLQILAISVDGTFDVPPIFAELPPTVLGRFVMVGDPRLVRSYDHFFVFSFCAPRMRFRGALAVVLPGWMTSEPFAANVSSASAIRSR